MKELNTSLFRTMGSIYRDSKIDQNHKTQLHYNAKTHKKKKNEK